MQPAGRNPGGRTARFAPSGLLRRSVDAEFWGQYTDLPFRNFRILAPQLQFVVCSLLPGAAASQAGLLFEPEALGFTNYWKTKKFRGELLPLLSMSLNSSVPASVPSLRHSSTPLLPSSAWK